MGKISKKGSNKRMRREEDIIHRKNTEEQEGKLSSLQDAILAEILSLLPIKAAVATSVLSRRWRHLWTLITKVAFSTRDFRDRQGCVSFDRILRRLTSPSIRTFHLSLFADLHTLQQEGYWFYYVESWIRQICRRKPEKIRVNLASLCSYEYVYHLPLPSCLFECQSLKKLNLVGGFELKLPQNGIITLPNLKCLRMWCVCDSNRDLMRMLLKSCPLLDDLFVTMYLKKKDERFIDISAPNLKGLSLEVKNASRLVEFVIDAPKLEWIDLLGYRSTSFRFANKPSGLHEASITLVRDHDEHDNDYSSKTMELIRGILSVRFLQLNAPDFSSLSYLDDDGVLPIFHNLTHLEIFDSRKDFLHFLQLFPKLEDLTLFHNLEDLKFRNYDHVITEVLDSVPACFISKLKRMKIQYLIGSNKELEVLKYILSNANVLELLCVCVFNVNKSTRDKELMFCENLFSHPRCSRFCEIKFSGQHLDASNKDFKEGYFDCRNIRHG